MKYIASKIQLTLQFNFFNNLFSVNGSSKETFQLSIDPSIVTDFKTPSHIS